MKNEILDTIKNINSTSDRQFVTALARGLNILYATRFYPLGISYQQICEMTKLPKPTVSRLLHTLVTLRFLRQNQHSGLYQADIRLLELTASHKNVDQTDQIKPLLATFATRYQVSVSLAQAEYGEMLYIQSIRSPARLAVQLQVGSTIPMAETATGRAYYAALTPEQRKLVQADLIRLFPNNYKSKIKKLEEQEKLLLAHGYTFSDKEFSSDITAIAVPIRHILAPNGLYALNASAPSSRMNLDTLVQTIANPLKELAIDIQNNYFIST